MVRHSPKDIQQRTFDFSIRIVKLVDRSPRTVAAVELGRQVLRSGVSVGANVQEADAAESKKRFHSQDGNCAQRGARNPLLTWNHPSCDFAK